MSGLPFFALLTFFAAFSIESIGTVVSVIGLSTLFGANPIIIALAVALDVGKLVVVALLYKYWGQLNVAMKAYGLVAAFVTMTITSAGAAGYLSGEFQKAIVGTQEVGLKVQVLKEEQAKLEARKKQIDDQIANLPSNYSRSRVTLMKQFEDEQKTITARLQKIQEELPQVQIAQISTEAKAGPILYIAKAFDISVEEAVKWVILMIIFVFDPLAVFLIVAGNFLLDQRSRRPPSSRKNLPVENSRVDHDQGVQNPVSASSESLYEIMEPSKKEDDTSVLAPAAAMPLAQAEHVEPPVQSSFEPNGPLTFREPSKSDGEQVQLEPQRDTITKSSLGLVKPDPDTKIADTGEIGYRTGVYRSGVQSK